MRDLLQATTSRAPVFHCFGLHEWAMLYRPRGAEEAGIDARSVHQALPLRVSQDEVSVLSFLFLSRFFFYLGLLCVGKWGLGLAIWSGNAVGCC